MEKILSEESALKLDAYFRAANYLSVGQLYLLDNPLLKRPLEKKDIKEVLLILIFLNQRLFWMRMENQLKSSRMKEMLLQE